MVESLATYGFRHFSPRALRTSLWLWWHDSNAIDLGKPESHLTVPVRDPAFSALSNHPEIEVGDLAVTESGSHVLAYLGHETWIEAEPNVGGTHVFTLTGQFAPLAGERVRFVRWRCLARTESSKS
jgi:hypothetical protein